MLSNSEKIVIVDQHIRSIMYSIYNAELDKLEATSVNEVDQNLVDSIDEKIASLNLKVAALESEKAKLAE